MKLQSVSAVIENYSGLPRIVLDYCQLMKQLVDEAKHPGFNDASWDPVKDLVDPDQFIRVGNFKEVMDWKAYVDFLTPWASSCGWECSFKRITQVENIVFLELEERSEIGDFKTSVNSLSVYTFDDRQKIIRMDIYLQMELPSAEVLPHTD